jgi:hypothetical protein
MIHIQAHVMIEKSPQDVWQQAASSPDLPTLAPTALSYGIVADRES